MKMVKGSPEDTKDRSERELRTYGFLDRLGVEFWRVDHQDQPVNTMEACAKIDELLSVPICKNLFLCNRQKTDHYLLVMPGDKPFKTKELSKQLETSRLSFGDEEHMLEYMDLYPGSVSILGLMNDKDKKVRLLMDRDVLEQDMFACHPCVNTVSIKFRMKDLLEKILPEMGRTPVEVILKGI